MTPEGKVKAAINRLLDQYVHYRFDPVQTGYGKKTLDKLLCVSGRFAAIEAKAPGKVPTELQESHMRDVRAAGGLTFVIDGDLTELKEWLETNAIRSDKPEAPSCRSASRTRSKKPVPPGEGDGGPSSSPSRRDRDVPPPKAGL